MSANFSMEIFICVVFAKYNMKTNTVVVQCDVKITYSGKPPVYRLYVGDELFAERNWIWPNDYLEEQIVIEAPFGLFPIRYELMPHDNAVMKVKNPKIIQGPGRFRKKLDLEIYNEAS